MPSGSVSLDRRFQFVEVSSVTVRLSSFAIGASLILVTFTWNVKVDILDSQASSVTRKRNDVYGVPFPLATGV